MSTMPTGAVNERPPLPHHRDARFRSGRVGLWTKAESITAFDDLLIRGMRR